MHVSNFVDSSSLSPNIPYAISHLSTTSNSCDTLQPRQTNTQLELGRDIPPDCRTNQRTQALLGGDDLDRPSLSRMR